MNLKFSRQLIFQRTCLIQIYIFDVYCNGFCFPQFSNRFNLIQFTYSLLVCKHQFCLVLVLAQVIKGYKMLTSMLQFQ